MFLLLNSIQNMKNRQYSDCFIFGALMKKKSKRNNSYNRNQQYNNNSNNGYYYDNNGYYDSSRSYTGQSNYQSGGNQVQYYEEEQYESNSNQNDRHYSNNNSTSYRGSRPDSAPVYNNRNENRNRKRSYYEEPREKQPIPDPKPFIKKIVFDEPPKSNKELSVKKPSPQQPIRSRQPSKKYFEEVEVEVDIKVEERKRRFSKNSEIPSPKKRPRLNVIKKEVKAPVIELESEEYNPLEEAEHQEKLELEKQRQLQLLQLQQEQLAAAQLTPPSPSNLEESTNGAFGKKYKRELCIGQGRYGQVWKAHPTFQSDLINVALKRTSRNNGQIPTTTIREAKFLMQLDHINICKQHEIGAGSTSIYTVLDYCNFDLVGLCYLMGDSLDANISRNLAYQLIKGISYLHSRDIVHRVIFNFLT